MLVDKTDTRESTAQQADPASTSSLLLAKRSVSLLLARERRDCRRQSLPPALILSLKTEYVWGDARHTLVLIYAVQNYPNLGHFTPADSAKEEGWEVAEGSDP